jgi:two-component system response regulator AtoC
MSEMGVNDINGNGKAGILIVDDEENMRHMLGILLKRHYSPVDFASSGSEALECVRNNHYDFVLCDVRMPDMDGLEFLETAKEFLSDSTVIMMSAYGTIELAIEAMKLGAYDFVSKPFKTDEILLTLKKAEERERLKKENRILRSRLEKPPAKIGNSFHGLVYKSSAMESVVRLASKVASYDTNVLVTGESGTGKEVIAKAIHAESGRSDRPMVAVNCGSIPEALLESEFFGHVKGAFTGANRDKPGLFKEAHQSTLFLDEIGDLPLNLQVKLLRVIQEGEIRPVGSTRSEKVDVRIIAATARDLEQDVQEGRFRGDLYYRLNVIHIKIPPLRERPEDIPVLAELFLNRCIKKFGQEMLSISPKTMSRLINYSWPGNVRELENVIERAVVLAEKNIILPENLPTVFNVKVAERRLDDFFSGFSIKNAQAVMEKQLISRALDATGGNKSKAAELLELSYPALLKKIKEYNIVVKKQ